jgi:hypothetical protein
MNNTSGLQSGEPMSRAVKSTRLKVRGYAAPQRKRHASALSSARTFPSRRSPKNAIPYSSAALRQDLDRLRGIWDDCQASRDRNAIYAYLTAVYGLVAWWTAEGREHPLHAAVGA